jgi:hypothetical protein
MRSKFVAKLLSKEALDRLRDELTPLATKLC